MCQLKEVCFQKYKQITQGTKRTFEKYIKEININYTGKIKRSRRHELRAGK